MITCVQFWLSILSNTGGAGTELKVYHVYFGNLTLEIRTHKYARIIADKIDLIFDNFDQKLSDFGIK